MAPTHATRRVCLYSLSHIPSKRGVRALIVADGYHRICAVCHYDEFSPVAIQIVEYFDRQWHGHTQQDHDQEGYDASGGKSERNQNHVYESPALRLRGARRRYLDEGRRSLERQLRDALVSVGADPYTTGLCAYPRQGYSTTFLPPGAG
jgi:hypothetical protein